jgi:phenylacetate-CoA ligase
MIQNLLFHYFELKRNLWLSPSDLKRIQEEKLRKVIKYAYEKVPFYRNLFNQEGIRPEDIRRVEDLQKLPVTSKDLVKNNPEAFVAEGYDIRKCQIGRTSGSTGKPMIIYFSSEDSYRVGLKMLRYLFEMGFKLTDKTVGIWREPEPKARKHWYQYLGLRREEIISLFDPVERKIQLLVEKRPDVLYGITSSLVIVAEALLKKGIHLKPPKIIFGTGEILDPRSREIIAKAYGTVPVNTYSTNEFGNIAWECPEYHNLHINSDCLVTEFLRDDQPVAPGETGRIYITTLQADVMPLIRYELGDLCVPSDETCACGRGLPLIKSVEGRTDDLIILPDGTKLNWQFFYGLVLKYLEVKQYRIIQEVPDSLRIILAIKQENASEVVNNLHRELQSKLPNIHITIELVDAIPPDPTGKIRVIISSMKNTI